MFTRSQPRSFWGISYATSGRVIARGMSPLVFFLFYTLFGAFAAAVTLVLILGGVAVVYLGNRS